MFERFLTLCYYKIYSKPIKNLLPLIVIQTIKVMA